MVARRIARMIEEESGDPDWRMPSERELAEELEVSRPVVSEAVIAPEMRGIVELKGAHGDHGSSRARQPDPVRQDRRRCRPRPVRASGSAASG
ncbi:GntR family transcriptional regulator [Aureimonas ureilytica]|uniref:GntR family transcriptional regulator n=1 Tax=Aureimonas ureilytica TaxID=401562 RepID=UPI003CFAA0AE